MGDLTVRVLGSIRASRDGVERAVSSRRQRALLAALVTTHPRPVSVSGLVDAVWDDEPPARARTTLQTYVSRLRGLLGTDAICHGPAGYWLSPDVWTDVGHLRTIVARLQPADGADARMRADLALEALGLWSGPPLAELDGHDWFRGVVVELAGVRANLVEVAADALIDTGRAPEALGLLEAAVADDPLREPTQLLLVRALHAAGRSLDAVRTADRYRVALRDETGLDPGQAFRQVEQLVLSGDGPPRSEARPAEPTAWSTVALPRPTPLIGRSSALAALDTALSSGRLVTVTGVGGVGKTRLVAEAVHGRTTGDQCVVVDLVPVAPGDVTATIGGALGYRAGRADVQTLAELLRGESVLVVLDNCEHLLAEVRATARVLVDACPGLRVLATSRVRLDLPDEHVVALEPLPVDGDGSPAVELFVDRLRRADSRFEPRRRDASLETLCARLDGVPLALELAASRAAVLGIETLAERLDLSLDLLVARDDSDGRHATIGNVVAWSIELLDLPARALLGALSVFQGEFDVGAAEAVGSAVVEGSVPMLLGRLVDTSLVSGGSGPGRYRLLDLIRRYATEHLLDAEWVDAVHREHALWIASRVEAIEAGSAGPDESATAARLDGVRHEVLAALRWAAAGGELDVAGRIATAVAGPVLYRPDPEMIRAVATAASEAGSGGAAPPPLVAAGARAAFLLGELPAVDGLAEQALAAGSGDRSARHRALHALGVVRLYQGRFDDSRQRFGEVVADVDARIVDRLDSLGGLALATCYGGAPDVAAPLAAELQSTAAAVDSETYAAFADYVRAEIHLAHGEVDPAVDVLTGATGRAWDTGAVFVWGIASTVLAALLVRHRPAGEAREHLPLLMDRWRRTATWPQLWTTLRLAAELFARDGQPEIALLILEAARRDPAAPVVVGYDLTALEALRSDLEAQLGEPASAGIVIGARAVDRVTVLSRAIDALSAAPTG